MKKNIAIFASGNGTNFEALVEACEKGYINANVVLMVCDNKDAYVIERAKNHNVETFVFSSKDYKNKKEAYETDIVAELKKRDVCLICLAGYMRFIGKVMLDNYEGKIINIHPALLPAFPGAHGILDAYNYGVQVFGVTIHYVDAGVDSGKIIDQASFHKIKDETVDEVEARIHLMEHDLYPRVVKRLLEEGY